MGIQQLTGAGLKWKPATPQVGYVRCTMLGLVWPKPTGERERSSSPRLIQATKYLPAWTPTWAAVSASSAAATRAAPTAPAVTAALASAADRFAPFAVAVKVGLGARLVRLLVSTLKSNCSGSVRRSFAAHLRTLLLQDGFARQLNAVAFDRQHLHQHLVALLEFIANIVDPMLGDFTDMKESVSARENLHERSEIGQPCHLSEIRLAYLGGRCDVANHLQRLGGGHLITGRDVHLAAIFHVDLDAGRFDDPADHLTARPDQVADFIGRNLQGVEAGSKFADLGTRLPNHLGHLVKNVQASVARLFQRLAHDLGRDAHHLDVHLQRGDAIPRARDFKVHVAVVVLGACDVTEDGVSVAFLHQSHGNARDRRLQGNAGI